MKLFIDCSFKDNFDILSRTFKAQNKRQLLKDAVHKRTSTILIITILLTW